MLLNTFNIMNVNKWLSWLPLIWVCSGLAAEVEFRARVTQLEPEQPVRIHWRWGGEGLGGRVVSGELTRFLPDEKPVGEVIVEGKTYNYGYLQLGSWSKWVSVSEFKTKARRLFVTFTLEGRQDGRALRDGELELEFRKDGVELKKVSVLGPDGPTFGVVVPLQHVESAEEFVAELGSLRDYARRKVEVLSEAPWAKLAAPKLYGIVTDCAGYKPGSGYGCRTADKATMLEEFNVLKLLGINGTRSCPDFVLEQIKGGVGIGPDFSRVRITHTTGYPINMVKRADGKAPRRSPGDGCPNHPLNVKGIPERVDAAVQKLEKEVEALPVGEVWALTVDEIGSVFDGSPEGKAHQGACKYCQEDFRRMVREDGRTLQDFGAKDWSEIRSTYGYWATSFWDRKQELEKSVTDARKRMDAEVGSTFDLDKENEAVDSILLELEEEKPKKTEGKPSPKALAEAEKQLRDFIWTGKVQGEVKKPQEHNLSEEGWDLLHYYSRKYNGEASARLFAPLRDAVAATGKNVYSYALRGNTFLMGGHSLGFFDFYKHADNGFVYETSNRDARVWQWDSYLCDVGRSLSRFRGKRFAVYVKPHRGAPVQRALSAVARGAKMIYWYTYGPDWSKGDTFGGKLEVLEKIGWVNRLIGQAEEVIYDSEWAVPAEVAIVRPRTAEFLSNNASWENGKWVHTALMHNHVPVDALDEDLLMELDLSSYKVVVVCGDHLRRDVAAKLKKWVKDGGHLVSYGNGMARDEANRPLTNLLPVLGLQKRGELELWGKVSKYGATKLRSVESLKETPAGAHILLHNEASNSFLPKVGREVLQPMEDAEVMAKYADGGAAIVRHTYGKGAAWTFGFYAGLEYATETMAGEPFAFWKQDLLAQPLRNAKILPVVEATEPLVEGILVKNRKTGRRAVILINWKFAIEEPLTLTLRSLEPVSSVRSLALNKTLPLHPAQDGKILHLPSLAEGDILLLE